jgi:diguanylate cyclase (GGDEF)-like protein
MYPVNVLIVGGDPESLALVDRSLGYNGYMLLRASNSEEAVRIISEKEIQIVLLARSLHNGDAVSLMKIIRGIHRTAPPQILLLSGPEDGVDGLCSSEWCPDDFAQGPLDEHELRARLRAAQARWQNQATILKEREFFRIAVAEEERLSSLVLDQNQNLKQAYEKIRALNEELAKANHELEQLATFDCLSGLLNRRSLFTRLDAEIDRCIRLQVPIAGLMVDIDKFKHINDNYGHQCGDTVIRELGAHIARSLRKYDHAGRYGGEEFFVILSNATKANTVAITERFRREIEETAFACAQQTFHITVSVGVSLYIPGEQRETWIERTDQAMYRAKQAGRNRVVTA